MKRSLCALLTALTLCLALCVSAGAMSTDEAASQPPTDFVYHTVTFDAEGGAPAPQSPQTVSHNGTVPYPAEPSKAGYQFCGWTYKIGEDTYVWDFSAPVTDDLALTAKWQRYHSTVSDGTLSRSDGSRLADENGSVTAEARGTDGRVTGFTADGRSLDGIDLKGLDLRLTVEDTKLSLSPAAIRQLLDANAGSLTLDMPGAEMSIPQELLRGIRQQLNGKDLEISLVSGETAMDGLSPEQKLWVPIMQERGKFLPLSALTGEFSVGGEPLDWSQISGSLDISLTLEMPKIEKKTGWHEENGQWIYYEENGEPMKPEDMLPLGGTNRLEFGYMVLDENDKWVRRGLEPPTILPLPDLRKLTDYEDLEQDWDLPRSEDVVPGSKWIDDSLLLNFKLPHFSTYLIVTRIAMPFDDVAEGAWYYDAVKWAVDGNLTGGTDNTHFSPNAACTRAQFVTFLWRLAGEPVVNYLMPFTDVGEDAWYAEAVRWAASERIAEGTTASTFAPNAAVSRAQAVTMLWRYAKHSGADVSVGKDTNILSYDDAFDIPAWAVEAVQWACGAQVLRGSGTALQPNDPCTRAQVAVMMSRLPKNAG